MSWLEKLYETYDHVGNRYNKENSNLLWPVSHFVKNAHIEIVLDMDGNFIKGRSKILNGDDSPTLIPATESSAGRSGSKIAPHPLCEEIGYCASDYPKAKIEKVNAFISQLKNWANSKTSHPKLKAILNYLEKETLWSDLTSEFEFPLKVKNNKGTSQKIQPEKVFLRWRVEEPANSVTGTWEDSDLINAWISYDRENNSKIGFCSILGDESRVALNHPRFLRWPGDGAKLVSSNDGSGFTFRGRFTDTKNSMEKYGLQAVGINFDITQKAHNALRWLISRQGYKNGDQVYVTWAVSGKDIPELLTDSWSVLEDEVDFDPTNDQVFEQKIDYTIDLGESFAHSFNKYLAGYRTNLQPNDQIVIMGLDSATPGRMSIIYYRELLASEFLDRIYDWHTHFAWPQRYTKEYPNPQNNKESIKKTIWPISAPIPRIIADTAYGEILKSNKSLKKSLLERILPCIVDSYPFPRDVMISAVRRVSNRSAYKKDKQWLWEEHLGIACALFKGFYIRNPDQTRRREYKMALEEDRKSRDYLYGRLLAIAERIEEVALNVGGENRSTTAARLMQRFADRPFSTWRNIELGLQPYEQRLQEKRAGFLTNRKKELNAIFAAFSPDDFTNDKPLSGEFLLGYHCQIQYWRNNNINNNENE